MCICTYVFVHIVLVCMCVLVYIVSYLYVCSCIYNPLFVCVFCIALVWKKGFAEYWSLNKNQSINQSIKGVTNGSRVYAYTCFPFFCRFECHQKG